MCSMYRECSTCLATITTCLISVGCVTNASVLTCASLSVLPSCAQAVDLGALSKVRVGHDNALASAAVRSTSHDMTPLLERASVSVVHPHSFTHADRPLLSAVVVPGQSGGAGPARGQGLRVPMQPLAGQEGGAAPLPDRAVVIKPPP